MSESKDLSYSIMLAFKLLLPRILTNHHCYFPKAGITLGGNHYERWMAFERNGNGEEERQNELRQNLVAVTKPSRIAAKVLVLLHIINKFFHLKTLNPLPFYPPGNVEIHQINDFCSNGLSE